MKSLETMNDDEVLSFLKTNPNYLSQIFKGPPEELTQEIKCWKHFKIDSNPSLITKAKAYISYLPVLIKDYLKK